MRFCSYGCIASDNSRAQAKACMTDSGVYCSILGRTLSKGFPCQVTDEDFDRYKGGFDDSQAAQVPDSK